MKKHRKKREQLKKHSTEKIDYLFENMEIIPEI